MMILLTKVTNIFMNVIGKEYEFINLTLDEFNTYYKKVQLT